MSLIRLFVEDDLSLGSIITLSRSQTHYLKNVMRKNIDDYLLIFNGKDGEWKARIKELGRDNCEVKVTRNNREFAETPDIWLIFIAHIAAK